MVLSVKLIMVPVNEVEKPYSQTNAGENSEIPSKRKKPEKK